MTRPIKPTRYLRLPATHLNGHQRGSINQTECYRARAAAHASRREPRRRNLSAHGVSLLRSFSPGRGAQSIAALVGTPGTRCMSREVVPPVPKPRQGRHVPSPRRTNSVANRRRSASRQPRTRRPPLPIASNGCASRPLKNSAGCVIAWMRCQNSDVSRYFASRAELCFALGEVEKCHDGIFQLAVKSRRASRHPLRRSGRSSAACPARLAFRRRRPGRKPARAATDKLPPASIYSPRT